MNKVLFLLPYVISLAISLGVLFYAWRFRNVRGAKAYTWYVAGQSLWVFGYIFELITPGLEGKIFWDQIQWIAGLFIAISFPVFTIQYTETKIARARLIFSLSLFIPFLFLITLLTDSQHHLLYPNPYLDHTYIFSDLKYDFTWVVYVYAIYGYLVTFTGLGILIRRLIRPHRLYRRQISTVAIGFFIPIFFTMLTVAGVEFMPFRDVSPFTFAIGNLIVAWGLFRYHLFDIIPIARDIVVENMEDLVVVLDMQDRVVDINPKALEVLNMDPSQIIGQPVEIILSKWPDLLEKFDTPENIKTELTIFAENRPFQYEIKSTLLHDKNERYIGRVFVSRDISEHTVLKSQLQKLNEELEERVAKRTEELSKSVEQHRESEVQFRELWGATVEGIVIHDRGIIIEINDAMCKLFDVVREQVIGKSLLEFAPDESAETVRKHIMSESEEPFETLALTFTGTKLLLKVFPKQINFHGKSMRMAAVRDITKSKEAEESLRESAERYRAVVENQSEFIVRWKPDRTRTFVNEAYCHYFGLTHEQAMSVDFMTLIANEDRAIVQEKISRLEAGIVDSEAEIHRVIKADGSIGWNEWIDTAIRDEGGNLIEFQSVGRDITERRQAEETILKQLAFEELMTDILTSFATCPHDEIDTRIQVALQKIATFMQVERAYMIIITPEHRKSWSVTHEWNAPHISPRIMVRNNLLFGTFPWAEDQILKGNVIRINTLDDYPSEASAIHKQHQAEGAKSILNVPVRGSENLISGCIGVNTYSYTSPWKDDDITHLKIIGDAIANLLERKRAEESLLNAYEATLEGWAKALELRDKETENHSRRVTEQTVLLAQAMGIDEKELIHIRRGAILHDIGKMGIPDEILRKRGPLTDTERNVIKQHPLHGYELLSPIPYLEKALDIPYCHHERWDGSGYPRGLKEEEIPLAARIFTVIDIWDALLSDRPYSKAWSKEETIQYLKDETGKIFDPKCVSVFLKLVAHGKI